MKVLGNSWESSCSAGRISWLTGLPFVWGTKRLFKNPICLGRCGMQGFQKTDLSLDDQPSYTAGPTFTQQSGLQ